MSNQTTTTTNASSSTTSTMMTSGSNNNNTVVVVSGSGGGNITTPTLQSTSNNNMTQLTSINLPSGLILNSTPTTTNTTTTTSQQVKILTPSSSSIKINQIQQQQLQTLTQSTSSSSSSSSPSGNGSSTQQVLPTIVTIPAVTLLQSTSNSTQPATSVSVILSNNNNISTNQSGSNSTIDGSGGTGGQSTAAIGSYGGFAYCSNCGEYGVKAAFYGKAKLYCSVACQNGIKKQNQQQQQGVKRPLDSINITQQTNNPAQSGITIIPVNSSGTTSSVETVTTISSVSGTAGDVIELKPIYSPGGESQPPAAKRPRKQSTSSTTAPLSSTSVIPSPSTDLQTMKKPVTTTNGTVGVLGVSESPNGLSNGKKMQQTTTATTIPFHWGEYVDANGAEAAPVHYFKHAPLRAQWRHVMWQNMLVEVPSSFSLNIKQEEVGHKKAYWFATVIGMAGYMLKVRYLGHVASSDHNDNDNGNNHSSSKEFWIHACDENLHRVGWAAQHKQILVPPSDIASKRDADSWASYIMETFSSLKSLPRYFRKWIREALEFKFKKNMRLEVLDKSQVSSMRVCRVVENVGGRIRVKYEGDNEDNEQLGDFWCHEASDLIHPVGWSGVVGHRINASHEYVELSRQKYVNLKFAADECTVSMFKQHPAVFDPRYEFRVGMKLEAIDPCNPGVICPATVARVLRKNYLMVQIDGVGQNEAGLDMFCYHRNSTSIFPINFCRSHNIQLNPPYNYTGTFSWEKYLKETGAEFAPPDLFLNSRGVENPFRVGMKLESVDLMEPGMVCVASVKQVAGRLLKLTFDGWDQNYDQWVDFESCDLFPVGWCQLVGYSLQEPPHKDLNASTGSKKSSLKTVKK